MNGRVAAVLLASLFAPGCGDSAPSAGGAPADVKGTPFLVRPAEAPAVPEVAEIGDLDSVPASARTVDVILPPVASFEPPRVAGPSSASAPVEAFEPVSFDELSSFEPAIGTDAAQPREVPSSIRALAGKRVVVDGYMMPLKYEAGGAKKFLLMRYRFGCCYAVSPKVNEWIEVTMEGGSVADYIPDMLVDAYGTLEVNLLAKDGAATGLYTMKAVRTEFTEAK